MDTFAHGAWRYGLPVAAAGLVAWTDSGWPDIAVAAAMAGLFLSSAVGIFRQAFREWRFSGT